MVIFDILLVSNDAKTLYVNAHINEAKYFEGFTITDIFINTDNEFLESGVDEDKAIYKKHFDDSPTKINLTISCNEVDKIKDFSLNLLFVYIRVKPVANECSECIPCELSDRDTLGVTFDTGLLYNIGLSYIKELANDCLIPQGFSDFVLNWGAFKLLIESGHYIDAVKLFNKLFKKVNTNSSNCGCNGKIFI